jgi:DNA-binding LacI/PurR family transcriptional regulator
VPSSGPAGPLLGTLPDGLLVLSPDVEEDPAPEPGDGGRPIVFVERHDGPGVTATNHEGEAEATRYLLALGHRRLGFVAGPPTHASSQERLDGFRAALAAAGIPHDPGLVAPGRNDRDSGLLAGRLLLALAEPPTAIVANNDLEAIGVLRAAREAGVRVPDDLSVVGFDDAPPAAHAHPPLTTVRQPLAEMGRRAAEMLIAWVEGTPPEPPRVVLPTRLVLRESCAPPAVPGHGDGRGGR